MADFFKDGIKIVSDGTFQGTKLFHPVTGEELTKLKVRSVTWKHEAGCIPRASIEFFPGEVDITALDSEAVEYAPLPLRKVTE